MKAKTKPAPRPDPAFTAIENHRNANKAFYAAAGALEDAELAAQETHGRRPSPLVSWRDDQFGESYLERVRELLRKSGVEAETLETEYTQ
jgi:hypothetical protein